MALFPSLNLGQKRSLLWLILGLLVIGVLWAASNVLLPYVLGLVLAYLLLLVVNWLTQRMPRLVIIPFRLFYILNDQSRVKEGLLHTLPEQLPFKYFFLRLSEEPLPPEEAMGRVRAGEELQLRV